MCLRYLSVDLLYDTNISRFTMSLTDLAMN